MHSSRRRFNADDKLPPFAKAACLRAVHSFGRSDDAQAVDRVASQVSTNPPPGLFKRTLPGEEIQPEFELMDYLSQRNVTLIMLAIMVVVSIVRKRFCKSHDETPNLHLVKQPSTSANKSQPCAVDDPKSYLANHISSSVEEGNGTQTCPSSQSQPHSFDDGLKRHLVKQTSFSVDEGNGTQPCPSSQPQTHSFDDLKSQLTKHTSASMDEGNGTQPRPSSHPTSDPAEHALKPTIKQPKDWSYVLLLLSGIGVLPIAVSKHIRKPTRKWNGWLALLDRLESAVRLCSACFSRYVCTPSLSAALRASLSSQRQCRFGWRSPVSLFSYRI